MAYVVGKFMARSGIKGYHVLLTGVKIITSDDKDETNYRKRIREEKEITELKLLNFTAYNELILAQEDIICFQIVEELKKAIRTEVQV